MDVRNVIAKEGRTARNLVSWHVPARNIQRKVSRSNSVKTSKSDTRANIKYEPRKQKISTQARYWSYLFENLKRAVDEIYELCSQDSSVDECKEAIMILECYKHEFESLSTWINLEKELKVSTKQPSALTWEVRKTNPVVKKHEKPKTPPKTPAKILSYADKVRNTSKIDSDTEADVQEVKNLKSPFTPRTRQNLEDLAIDDYISEKQANGQSVSWAEMSDIVEEMRLPGGAAIIHEKLSSPSRKKHETGEKARKRLEEKFQKAEQRREEIVKEKMDHGKKVEQRLSEVREWKEQKTELRRQALNDKLSKAEDAKNERLQSIKNLNVVKHFIYCTS